MIEYAIAAVPDGSRFPGTASVNHDDRCLSEAGQCIATDGVRQMVFDKAHLGFARSEMLGELIHPPSLQRHAQIMGGHMAEMGVAEGEPTRDKGLERVPIFDSGAGPA